MRAIPSWPDYFADEDGNVYSMKHHITPIKLRPYHFKGSSHLRLAKNGKSFGATVASLILETFVGPRPKGFYACHGPNGSRDNSLHNLLWQSPVQNSYDRIRDGTHLRGETIGNHKLTETQVKDIREYCKLHTGYGTQRQCAKLFHISEQIICNILHRRRWAWLT